MELPTTLAWQASNGANNIQDQVYLGLWTNWSSGSVLGLTLTMTRGDGNVLTAFTASFIVYVGTRVWHIASLVLHHYFSTREYRDVLHHQRQVLLRNLTSADEAVYSFAQLSWNWRRSSVRSLRRIAPLLILSIILSIGFTLASVFSSLIQFGDSTQGSDVLLKGTNCAIMNMDVSTLEQAMAADTILAKWIANSVNYVQQCYSANSSGLSDCNYFAVSRIPAYVDTQNPCPFQDTICKNASNIVLDTGFLNSHEHFGINAPADERILMRSVLECAPLVTEGYTISDGNFTAYDYGLLLVPDDVGAPVNYSYEVYSSEWQYKTMNDYQLAEVLYQLKSIFAGTVNNTPAADAGSTFTPNNQLARTDADLTIAFLSGYGVFSGTPIYDPWYQSTTDFVNTSAQGKSGWEEVYRQDEAASPLACASQWQFCNVDSSACGPLASYEDAYDGASLVFADPDAADRFLWFANSLSILNNMLQGMLEMAQVDALLAKQSVDDGYQETLPDNQWQLEVTNWFAICLAFLQQAAVETASGALVSEPNLLSLQPTSSAEKKMCHNQKIRTTKFSTFSFFGLLIIYIFGLVLIAISFCMKPILRLLFHRRGSHQYGFLEWNAQSTLQLHRLACGNHGDWIGCTEEFPLPKDPVLRLRTLDTSDTGVIELSEKTKITLVTSCTSGSLEDSRKDKRRTL